MSEEKGFSLAMRQIENFEFEMQFDWEDLGA